PAPGRPDRVLGATGVHTLTVVDGIHVVPAGGELGRRGRAGRDVLPLAAEIVHGEGDLGARRGLAVVSGQLKGVGSRSGEPHAGGRCTRVGHDDRGVLRRLQHRPAVAELTTWLGVVPNGADQLAHPAGTVGHTGAHL